MCLRNQMQLLKKACELNKHELAKEVFLENKLEAGNTQFLHGGQPRVTSLPHSKLLLQVLPLPLTLRGHNFF